MRSENVTEGGRQRWYDDACGTALALELVGERWSLLIVRELMFGPRRFGELRSGLPGISANVLTQRLEGMERVGILVRRKLPSPANVQVYELTPWGYESERAIQELGRWAVRSPAHDATLPLSAASMMMSLRTMYAGGLAGMTIGFRMGDEQFVATPGETQIAIVRADPFEADVVLEGPPEGIAAVVYGGVRIDQAAAGGLVQVTGDRAMAERFLTRFPLPAKTA